MVVDTFTHARSFLGVESDSDHDSNVALTELDKGEEVAYYYLNFNSFLAFGIPSTSVLIFPLYRPGLRSTNVGEQCEAIVRFPRLFERYPFPILINCAMLKLADVMMSFAAGSSNFSSQ